MSTRMQIATAGTPILIYQHSDGYPSYALATLLPFLVEFHKGRGHDSEYLPAQLLARMISRRQKEQDEFHAQHPDLATFRDNFTGYGIDTQLHGDIEYLYEIDELGGLTVSTVTYQVGVRKFVKLAKFKLGTTYKAAMARLERLSKRRKSWAHIAA